MWKILNNIQLFVRSTADFFFPRFCKVCGNRLSLDEQMMCSTCLLNMPVVRHASYTDNEVARTFWGLIPIERGTAFFHYTKASAYTHILFDLKYHNHPEIGLFMGRMMASQLLPHGFFDGINLLLPIPLSPQKKRQRGYNQSEWIARGIAEVTGIAIDTESVRRIVSNPSQTHLSDRERRENVRNIFSVTDCAALEDRHLLLIDDVMTTGATILSCAEAISQNCTVRISVLSMAYAGHS